MTEVVLAAIGWGDVAPRINYLYGSHISYKEQGVYFENVTFASGKPIKTWRSRTNYQDARKSPELPPLQGGKSYRLVQKISVEPQGAVYLQLQFFNRQGEEIGRAILRGKEETFLCPPTTFTYQLQLISAGCHNLFFQQLTLYGPPSPGFSEAPFRVPEVTPDPSYQKILAFVEPVLEDRGVL